jgi:hypothetical protein
MQHGCNFWSIELGNGGFPLSLFMSSSIFNERRNR